MTLFYSLCAHAADDVFLYSSTSQIRGINLTLGTENLLTTTPFTASINALATNSEEGLVYYGAETEIFVWDVSLGNAAAAHSRLNDFASGAVQAPITNLESGSGSYLNGVYYVGSEQAGGDVDDLYAITLSADGRTVLSVQALGLLNACNCTSDEIGGFGDIAAIQEGASTVLYAISTGGSDNTVSGRWRFDVTSNTWSHLAAGANGQLSNSISGQLYTNVGNEIRTLNKTTGALGTTNLFTTAAAIYDFTGGFSLDFGDAPASYGAAIHRVPAQTNAAFYLGTLPPDNEAGTLNSTAASINGLGDDQNGIDDEDAVVSLNSVTTDDTNYAFAVSCSTGAYVSAWIDFNLNGSFDAGERHNNAPTICSGSSTTLAWTGLSSTVAGTSYARIRVAETAAQVAEPIGLSNSGEVEDHTLTIIDTTTSSSCPAGQVSSLYSSVDVPKTIPVGASSATSSSLTIPTTGNVLDLNVVNVIGTHTWLDDIRLTLIRGTTTVDLFGPACSNNDNFNFGFDDESGNALVCPPTNGNNIDPNSALSVFDGAPATGDWTLDIQDVYPTADGGILQSWALQICTLAGPAENPDIRLGKVAVVENNQVTLTFRAVNSGNTSLSNIRVIDNLDDALGAGTYTIIQTPQIMTSPAGFIANASYTGSGLATDLLGSSGTLAPAEELVIKLVVRADSLTAGSSVASYTNQAYTSAISPSSGFTEDLSAPSLDLSVDTDAPTPILIRNTLMISGRVFIDSSTTTANSHDGVIQADETGVGKQRVSISNQATGQLIDSVITDGDGDWAVTLDAALEGTPLLVQIQASADWAFISEASAYRSGVVTDGVLQVTPSTASVQNDINSGVVARPTLQPDNTQTALPNTSVRHAHRYVAGSTGTLTFNLNTTANPASILWPSQLLLDQNCNGVIEAGDSIITGNLSVVRDDNVCLIVDVFVPANSPVGANHTASLTATLSLNDPASIGHAVQFQNSNTDSITVIAKDNGRLVLKKSVSNVTLGGVASDNNTALPGHVLEYTIHYENQGSGPISDLVINDSAPAFTQVQGASVQCVVTPAQLSCTPGVASAQVRWDFMGDFPAAASGSVSYRVTID